jgi:fibronectin-binding autotransporter adhesin
MNKQTNSTRRFATQVGRAFAVTTTLAVTCAAFTQASAADISKADNADTLNLGSAWSGGVVPTSADVAVWDSAVTAINTINTLGASTNWAGVRILNPAAGITIITNAGGNVLTLGASGIDMTSAGQDLTLSNNVTLLTGSAQSWNVASGRLLTIAGTLSRPATGNGATMNFDTTAGGTINIASGTASALLLGGNAPFATLNFVDFAALDASRNVVAAVSFYGDYSAGGNLSGTYGSGILNITGTAVGSTQAWRNSNALTVPNGVRFNVANTQNIRWTVDTSSAGRLLTTGAILIGPGVGAQNVEFNGSGGVRPNGNSQDLVLHQNNPSGDLIFNTTINNAAGSTPATVVKAGPGRVIFNSTGNYTGPTRIEAGTFLANGTLNASSAVTVNNGATLGGSGTVNGSVTVQVGGRLAPSNVGVGALTVQGALTLSTGTTYLDFYSTAVPTTNTAALLVVTNNALNVNGTVNISILSGSLAVGQYPLLRWSNAIPSGTFSAFNLAAIAPHVSAFLSNNTANSTIDLVVTSVNQPLRWAAGSGIWDINTTANWKDLLGAATTYQQTVFAADAVWFEDSQSGSSPISVTINSAVTPPSVNVSNVAKSYTLTGAGSIGGAGSLIKQGAGTLTLATDNTFTGPINLAGGTTVFSSLANLGAGTAINFDGGVLSFASGNTADISARTVTFNSGGATLNDGGNFITFASPIGNNGAGGLTKTGAGSLTLTGTNRYAGNTLISGGTLALGFESYISNSPAIIVSSGATLDVTGNGLITLASGVSQKLAGVGSVNGSVVAPTSTTITPATNGTIGTFTINSGDLTVSGATLAADLTPSTRDLIVVNGSVTLTSGSLQLNVSGTLANGNYTLIQYSGALNGSAGNLAVSGYSPAGKSVTLSDATAGQINLVIADSATDTLTWSGSTSADWDTIGTLNWLNGVNSWAYTNGSFVTFDDSGAAQPFVQLQAAVAPGSVTVNNPTVNYTFSDPSGTGVGKITGSTVITKSGAGTLTINTINNNSGPLVINAGTVQVGDNASNGALGTGNITNNSALIFAQTDNRAVSGVVSGSGTLTQQGNAGTTLTLSGAQTYTGPTVINSGVLQVGAGNANGVMASTSITNNGTLILNSTTSWALAAPVSGTGGLTKQATNTLTLVGDKSHTGRTSVEGGKLILTAADQLKGELRVQSGGSADINGFDQTLIGLSSTPAFSGGRLVNNSGAALKVLTITNATDFDCSIVVADNDGTGGSIAVVKDGPGALQWRGNNTYSGGTTIKEGNVRVTTSTAFGTGGVTMLGGRLIFGAVTVANPINAVSNVIIEANGNGTYTGALTGTNTVDFQIDGNETFTWNGTANQLAGFSGTILIRPGNGFFRFNGSRGSAAATFDLTGSIATINSASVGAFELGALVGDSGSFLGANAGSSFIIGGKNLDTEYAGTLNAVNNTLVKAGTGTFTLSGVNSFTGSTIVSNGVLALTGSAELDDSPTISVKSGASLDVAGIGGTLNLGNLGAQTLSGAGTVRGSVNQGALATISPGDSIGVLTVTNTIMLGGTNLMEINRTNSLNADRLIAQQGFIVSGTPYVVVQNIGPTNFNVGDTFQLFSQPISGLTVVSLPTLPCAGLSWSDKLAVNGSIEVVGTPCVNLTPTNITSTVTGNSLDLQWPADHTGWTLQTNSVSVADANAWFAYPGSAMTNRVILSIDPAKANVFFRLVYP